MNTINLQEAIELVKNTSQGAEFLKNNPDYDAIITIIHPPAIRTMIKEYSGLFPFKKMQEGEEFNIIAISFISRRIIRRGYPKLKIYVKDLEQPEDTSGYVNNILRIITSE